MQLAMPCRLTKQQARLLFASLVRQMHYFFGDVATLQDDGDRFLVRKPNPFLAPAIREALVQARGDRVVVSCVLEDAPAVAQDADIGPLVTELEQLVSFPVHTVERRVFGVGWQKTGTVSLAVALRSLGYLTCHFAPWMIGHRHCTDAATGVIDLEWIEPYGAVLDVPAASFYRELDERFPGSLFVLTTRPTHAWLDSAEQHVARCTRAFGTLPSVDRWAYQCDVWDRAAFRARYERHVADVLDYFGGRRDFLCLDVTQGDPWPPLCRLLGVPLPAEPFPHLNRRPPQQA